MIIVFKYCADIENCESFRGFDFIYIYIYREIMAEPFSTIGVAVRIQ